MYSNRRRTLQSLVIISPGTAGVTEMRVIVKPVRTSSWAVTLRQAETILRTTSLTNIESTGERVQGKPATGPRSSRKAHSLPALPGHLRNWSVNSAAAIASTSMRYSGLMLPSTTNDFSPGRISPRYLARTFIYSATSSRRVM